MCNCINCIKEAKQRTIEFLVNEQKDKSIINQEKCNFSHITLSLGDNIRWRTYQEFHYRIAPIKKDGSIGKEKEKTISIYHSFCPFCGEKVPI